jgi:hypothetical protein
VRPGEGRSSDALLEEPRTGVDSWAWLSVGWLIRSRYMPIQEKSLIYLLILHCVFAVLGLAQRGLAHEVQVHAYTRKSLIYLVYFTLCVWRPGLGSAWAGSLDPGTCLQDKSLITVKEGNFVIDV